MAFSYGTIEWRRHSENVFNFARICRLVCCRAGPHGVYIYISAGLWMFVRSLHVSLQVKQLVYCNAHMCQDYDNKFSFAILMTTHQRNVLVFLFIQVSCLLLIRSSNITTSKPFIFHMNEPILVPKHQTHAKWQPLQWLLNIKLEYLWQFRLPCNARLYARVCVLILSDYYCVRQLRMA